MPLEDGRSRRIISQTGPKSNRLKLLPTVADTGVSTS
jgi:hypothetical protein